MTLDDRATKLQALLHEDGIEASLEECRHLIICDFVDQLRSRASVPA